MRQNIVQPDHLYKAANEYERTHNFEGVYHAFLAGYGEASKELADLRYWKESQIKLWGPVIEFMQSHPDLTVGDNIAEKVLQFLKEHLDLRVELDTYKRLSDDQAETVVYLNEKLLKAEADNERLKKENKDLALAINIMENPGTPFKTELQRRWPSEEDGLKFIDNIGDAHVVVETISWLKSYLENK